MSSLKDNNREDASSVSSRAGEKAQPPVSVLPEGQDKDYFDNTQIVLKKAEIEAEQYMGSGLHTAFLLISLFIIGYGYGLDSSVRSIYTTLAAASYNQHSLISTIGVINGVIAAASQIVFARLSDVFGRLWLLIISIVFYAMGTVIQSQAYDIQRYCAGAVFYNMGFIAMVVILLLISSDVSSLRWRMLYQLVPSLPFIINTWISGNVTDSIGYTNWQWGIGMWAFIFPLTSLPLIACLFHMKYLARKDPRYQELRQQQTYFQKHGIIKTIIELLWRVDALGVFTMVVCLGCLLVPLTLAAGVTDKWRSGKIIGPLVLGFVLIPVFVIIETKVAKHPMAPKGLLKDRGTWSALILAFFINFIFYVAFDYLYAILIVAVNQTTKSATRISSLYSFADVLMAPFVAIVVAWVRRVKPFIVTGMVIWFISMGLMYHYRGGEDSKAGIIGGLVLWGCGTSLFSYPIYISLQGSTTHEHLATVTALVIVVYRVGQAVGNSVSGAIWTQLLPARLTKDLGNATMATSVYGDPYTFAASYPWNTTERQAVVSSYRYIQRYEILTALCFCVMIVVFSLLLRDPKLTDDIAYEQKEMTDGGDVRKTNDAIYDMTIGRFFGENRVKAKQTEGDVSDA
ncbi:CYFA0S08e02960g1_1 [Cyberlindnera fabianii]|uniref:CYFA0S08e02960g1_1 n=1 Tax=Cyberlindnera fabianii TaxID=36022 RepID=A0A061AWZ3_CYBFA|nr:CYFA0S08e02960g1_1 [Cyberlindnera fabianii]